MCDYADFMQYPIDESMRVFGKRWAGPVLLELLNGLDSFNMLLHAIPRLNPRSLSARLDDFERAGIVARESVSSQPVRVRYRLTPKGEDMRPLLRELVSFSLRWYSG